MTAGRCWALAFGLTLCVALTPYVFTLWSLFHPPALPAALHSASSGAVYSAEFSSIGNGRALLSTGFLALFAAFVASFAAAVSAFRKSRAGVGRWFLLLIFLLLWIGPAVASAL